MTEDEKYVQDNWERAEVCESMTRPEFIWSISLGGRGFTRACIPENWARSEAEAWSAAAEFTRTRLQQIRDVEEEIAWLDREATICDTEQDDWLKSGMDVMASSCSDSAVVIRRISTARQAALADLKRGLRVAE